jgi:hypothetical protein
VADDIQELNALIADYGREFQSPDPRRGPSLGSSRLYADYQPATSSEQVEMLLSMLPVIGEGLDAANLAQYLGNREYGKAGLSGLAMVLPGVGAGVIKKIGKNLPENKQGLSSINIDDELFKDVLKTPEGDPVILYRGSGINDSVEDAVLSGKSRDNYATFMSDSPYVAETYAPKPDKFFPDEVGVVTPFVVKPEKVIEYKVKPGSTFNKFEFDRQAQNLSPGEVLVARDVYDVGPHAVVTGPDDPKYFSYSSDVYATKDPSILQSPFSAKEVKTKSASDAPKQAISSADTSLRQVPALFKKQNIDFPEGGTNFDIGGGRFDEGTKYLADERGVENFVYDPYNRSPEHNAAVMDRMRTKAADTATAANVLNVIAEPEARADVIRQAIQNIKPGGTAYFQIYEGAGTGVGKVTSKGFQNNKKTADYIGEVEEIFGPDNVRRKGNVIIATKPVEYRRGGSVVERSNNYEPKAI